MEPIIKLSKVIKLPKSDACVAIPFAASIAIYGDAVSAASTAIYKDAVFAASTDIYGDAIYPASTDESSSLNWTSLKSFSGGFDFRG